MTLLTTSLPCIAQWLEPPTGIWKVMGSTPVGGSENSFSDYFDLRTLLHYIYTLSKSPIHLSFIHIYHFDTLSLAVWQDTFRTYKNLVYDLAHFESPIAQWLEHPTISGRSWVRLPLGAQKILFLSIST